MLDISIHAPREGCDKTTIRAVLITLIFQSTHPARGATHSFPIPSNGYGNFNPRTPRGVRHSEGLAGQGDGDISIHAPREGCDPFLLPQLLQSLPISIHAPREGCDQTVEWDEPFTSFQSTHPARGATANFTKEQRVCLAQFAYLHKGKKAEHTKTNAPMLH